MENNNPSETTTTDITKTCYKCNKKIEKEFICIHTEYPGHVYKGILYNEIAASSSENNNAKIPAQAKPLCATCGLNHLLNREKQCVSCGVCMARADFQLEVEKRTRLVVQREYRTIKKLFQVVNKCDLSNGPLCDICVTNMLRSETLAKRRPPNNTKSPWEDVLNKGTNCATCNKSSLDKSDYPKNSDILAWANIEDSELKVFSYGLCGVFQFTDNLPCPPNKEQVCNACLAKRQYVPFKSVTCTFCNGKYVPIQYGDNNQGHNCAGYIGDFDVTFAYGSSYCNDDEVLWSYKCHHCRPKQFKKNSVICDKCVTKFMDQKFLESKRLPILVHEDDDSKYRIPITCLMPKPAQAEKKTPEESITRRVVPVPFEHSDPEHNQQADQKSSPAKQNNNPTVTIKKENSPVKQEEEENKSNNSILIKPVTVKKEKEDEGDIVMADSIAVSNKYTVEEFEDVA
jgi:hypothetical protein